jgi:hypothetical protein
MSSSTAKFAESIFSVGEPLLDSLFVIVVKLYSLSKKTAEIFSFLPLSCSFPLVIGERMPRQKVSALQLTGTDFVYKLV